MLSLLQECYLFVVVICCCRCCYSLFVGVAVVVCWVLLFVVSNPRLPFNILLFVVVVVVVVVVRGLCLVLVVCLCVFVVGLLVRFLILECRSTLTFNSELCLCFVVMRCRCYVLFVVLLLLLWSRFVVCCSTLAITLDGRST